MTWIAFYSLNPSHCFSFNKMRNLSDCEKIIIGALTACGGSGQIQDVCNHLYKMKHETKYSREMIHAWLIRMRIDGLVMPTKNGECDDTWTLMMDKISAHVGTTAILNNSTNGNGENKSRISSAVALPNVNCSTAPSATTTTTCSSVAASIPSSLQQTILNVLSSMPSHQKMTARMIYQQMRLLLPDLTLKDVNACLYTTLIGQNLVCKTNDAPPLWYLARDDVDCKATASPNTRRNHVIDTIVIIDLGNVHDCLNQPTLQHHAKQGWLRIVAIADYHYSGYGLQPELMMNTNNVEVCYNKRWRFYDLGTSRNGAM